MNLVKLFIEYIEAGYSLCVNIQHDEGDIVKKRGIVVAVRGTERKIAHATGWQYAPSFVFEGWVRRMYAAIDEASKAASAKWSWTLPASRMYVDDIARKLGMLPKGSYVNERFLAKHGEEIIALAIDEGLITEGEAKRIRRQMKGKIEWRRTGKPYWSTASTKADRAFLHRRARRVFREAVSDFLKGKTHPEDIEAAGLDVLDEYLD